LEIITSISEELKASIIYPGGDASSSSSSSLEDGGGKFLRNVGNNP
jgi:hypothetical protein